VYQDESKHRQDTSKSGCRQSGDTWIMSLVMMVPVRQSVSGAERHVENALMPFSTILATE